MLSEKLGKVLIKVKTTHGVKTQKEFAHKVGVPIERLKNMLTGRVKKLTTEEIRAIQLVYGVRDVWWDNEKAPMLLTKEEQSIQPALDDLYSITQEVRDLHVQEEYARFTQELLQSVRRKDGTSLTQQIDRLRAGAQKDYIYVPRYDVTASAGGGSMIHDESIVDHLAFKRDWLTQQMGCKPDSVCVIQVRGDSMSPTINEADLLLLDMRTLATRTEGVYVIQLQGNLLVKRLRFKLSGEVDVISDNPRYGTETLTNPEVNQLSILGRVVWHGCKF
jgi:phage repressor protein C with HTH and peptisase S24 domain